MHPSADDSHSTRSKAGCGSSARDECERLFRETTLRGSTENIGMAVVYDKLDLVRVGNALRQELAVWRYADELVGRRRRALVRAGATTADRYGWLIGAGGLVGAGVALLTGAPLAIGVGMIAGAGTDDLLRELGPARIERMLGRVIAKVRLNALDYSLVRTGHVPELRLGRAESSWRLELPHSVGWEAYTGRQGTHVLGVLLPIANGFGASREQVTDAVRELEEAGTARAYFPRAAARIRALGLADRGVRHYPASIRLALEMAAHEQTEREALRGEIAWLEHRWRRAESIAEIADNLFATTSLEDATSTNRA
jgi:hypothetical protein